MRLGSTCFWPSPILADVLNISERPCTDIRTASTLHHTAGPPTSIVTTGGLRACSPDVFDT